MNKPFEQVPEEFVTSTMICDYKTPLSEAMQKVDTFGAIVVQKNKEYYGIVDSRSISRRSSRLKLTKSITVDKFSERSPVLDSSTSIEKAIANFYYSANKALAYTNGKRITGIVKREKMLSAILSMHLLSKFNVSSALSSPVLAIDYGANVAQAKKTMLDHNVNKLAVVENGKLFGILTYRHISPEMNLTSERFPDMEKSRYSASNISVGSVCERDVHTIDREKSIDESIKLMLEKKISSLMVVKAQKPVGIITPRDIFELVVANTGASKDNLIVSGLDDSTKEYESEMKESMQELVDKVNKFHKIQTHYMSLNVRKSKGRNYELKARLISEKNGSFSTAAAGYSLEQTVTVAMDKIFKLVKEKKDIMLTAQTKRGKDNEE